MISKKAMLPSCCFASVALAEYLPESIVHGWVKGLAGLRSTTAEHEDTTYLKHVLRQDTSAH